MDLKNITSLLLLAGTLTVADSADARIYKTTDEQGNVVFTDVPPKDESKAIELDERNVYRAAPVAAPPVVKDPKSEPEEEVEVRYQQLSIQSPTEDEAVRENAGNLRVSVSMQPNLRTDKGHSLRVLIDGVEQANGPNTQISLENVDRGSHKLTAQILDDQGAVMLNSEPVTFHMLRATVRRNVAN